MPPVKQAASIDCEKIDIDAFLAISESIPTSDEFLNIPSGKLLIYSFFSSYL